MNTILITGGTSGIGRGLAEAFHRLGDRVIIGGRRRELLESICAANPGMSYYVLDVTSPSSIKTVAQQVISRHPDLNWLINNAGVQREHDFSADAVLDEEALDEEIDANLKGVVRMCAAFLPHLRFRQDATIVNVSSGLAFVPLAKVPVYCATKAAVHSFCLSLRHQLRGAVRVIELIPPYVDTDLDKDLRKRTRASGGPAPMPLDEFIAEAMKALVGDEDELAIGGAKFLHGAAKGEAGKVFARMNPS